MSYDISFKVKVEGLEDTYVSVGEWDDFCNDSWTSKLADVTYFWIE